MKKKYQPKLFPLSCTIKLSVFFLSTNKRMKEKKKINKSEATHIIQEKLWDINQNC